MIGAIRKVDSLVFGGYADQYVRLLEQEIVGQCDTLLDVGCGRSSPIGRLCSKLKRTTGVDGFAPYVAESRTQGLHTDYQVMDVSELGSRFKPQSYDCVVALDLIEHLTKPAGERLLHDMERIAAKKVIVFTPNGFVPQTSYDDNSLQEHLSGWEVGEMRGRGYRVVGVHGWKSLRGERARITWRPGFFWSRVSMLSQPLTLKQPKLAYALLCVKDL